jgi:hypothetical protein
MRDELVYPRTLLLREVEVHVRGLFLELAQDLCRRRTLYVVDFVDLV